MRSRYGPTTAQEKMYPIRNDFAGNISRQNSHNLHAICWQDFPCGGSNPVLDFWKIFILQFSGLSFHSDCAWNRDVGIVKIVNPMASTSSDYALRAARRLTTLSRI